MHTLDSLRRASTTAGCTAVQPIPSDAQEVLRQHLALFPTMRFGIMAHKNETLWAPVQRRYDAWVLPQRRIGGPLQEDYFLATTVDPITFQSLLSDDCIPSFAQQVWSHRGFHLCMLTSRGPQWHTLFL